MTDYIPQKGDYVSVTVEGYVNDGDDDGYFEVEYLGFERKTNPIKVEKIDPPKPPLPTENGVYVPSHNSLSGGPNVFILYNGEWRASATRHAPTYLTTEEWVSHLHEEYGLVPLTVKEN